MVLPISSPECALTTGVDVTGALPRKFVIDVDATLTALLSAEGSFISLKHPF